MFRRPVLVALAALSAAGVAPASAAAPCAGADLAPAAAPVAVRAATLCLLNRERAAHGLRPLRHNQLLALAARRHARDMVRGDYFAHDSQDGRSFDVRVKATGYLESANGWDIGENLAWGAGVRATPRQIVATWMASPAHRANILTPAYREIGLGIALGAPVAAVNDAATYATEFGRRG